jgi:hypothetical protein
MRRVRQRRYTDWHFIFPSAARRTRRANDDEGSQRPPFATKRLLASTILVRLLSGCALNRSRCEFSMPDLKSTAEKPGLEPRFCAGACHPTSQSITYLCLAHKVAKSSMPTCLKYRWLAGRRFIFFMICATLRSRGVLLRRRAGIPFREPCAILRERGGKRLPPYGLSLFPIQAGRRWQAVPCNHCLGGFSQSPSLTLSPT